MPLDAALVVNVVPCRYLSICLPVDRPVLTTSAGRIKRASSCSRSTDEAIAEEICGEVKGAEHAANAVRAKRKLNVLTGARQATAMKGSNKEYSFSGGGRNITQGNHEKFVGRSRRLRLECNGMRRRE